MLDRHRATRPALALVMQLAEGLSGSGVADLVRARSEWMSALSFGSDDGGLGFSTLGSSAHARSCMGGASAAGSLREQLGDSTLVLAAIR
jgi:hypothetical protein